MRKRTAESIYQMMQSGRTAIAIDVRRRTDHNNPYFGMGGINIPDEDFMYPVVKSVQEGIDAAYQNVKDKHPIFVIICNKGNDGPKAMSNQAMEYLEKAYPHINRFLIIGGAMAWGSYKYPKFENYKQLPAVSALEK